MQRRDFLQAAALGTAAFALPLAALRAASFDFDHDPITSAALPGTKLHILMGQGGNITLLDGPDGLVQFDSGVSSRGKDVLAADRKVEKKGPALLINTHWHGDHVGGNEVAANSGAQIFAHEKVRTRLAAPSTVDFFKSSSPAYPDSALPKVTFPDTFTLYANGETIHLVHVAPAHTDTDIIAHFVNNNVVVAGDLFFNGFYPFIDYSSGGNIGGMIAGTEQILALFDAKTQIVSGHGPVGTKEQLQSFHDMLVTVRDSIVALKSSGKTEAETVAAKPTASLDAQWGHGLFTGDQFVQIVYRGLANAPSA